VSDDLFIPEGVTRYGQAHRDLFGSGVVVRHLGDFYAVYVNDRLTRLRRKQKDANDDARALVALVKTRR
jgi:hypothetical protein